MRKLKTNSAIQKRLKKTKTGKYLRRKAFKSHILEKKSQKRKRRLRVKAVLTQSDLKNLIKH
uniref:50S ribosomal protein L35 n=1 Tax=Olisthodiscus luteus TaxID=83000 RepID=A0A7U0KSL7_OLILU|nr:ribosomal protein L35 [Olisthodiscus luteus]YP_010152846.1 ribosomal protein L35 [Olisthodiscus luteus]QQW50445.1 ribosomal protein L35 [Olisthodiscus luteus]QQW50507.1 ribosomal protein L35 [Olisthodiscus luteus]